MDDGRQPGPPTARAFFEAVAALVAGAVVATQALTFATPLLYVTYGPDSNLTLLRVAPLLAVLALAAFGAAAAAGRWTGRNSGVGWWIAAAGLAGHALIDWLTPDIPQAGQPLLIIVQAGLFGVLIAGTISALAGAAAARRPVVVAGFAAGVALSAPALRGAAYLLNTDGSWSYPLVLAIGAVLLGLAGVLAATARPAGPAEPVGEDAATAGTSWGFAAWAAGGATVVWLALTRGVTLLGEVVGTYTQRRTELYENVLYYFGVVLAVAVVAGCALYGYRRGRGELARWVVLCFGLAIPVFIGSRAGLSMGRDQLAPLLLSIALAGLAAAAGAVLAVRAADAAPWDAMGVLAAALGVLLSAGSLRMSAPGLAETALPAGLILVATAFTLTVGLIRLLRTTGVPSGRLAVHGVFGLVVLLLTLQALSYPLLSYSERAYGQLPPMTPVALCAAAAVTLLLLHGMRRAILRLRRDMAQEAAAGPN